MIKRGTNECGIEEDVVAGLPSAKNLIREIASVDADANESIWRLHYFLPKTFYICDSNISLLTDGRNYVVVGMVYTLW